MLKRVTALLLLASMLLAVLPVSAAELNTPVEDFTVKQTDSGFTVILPDGYAEKGFFKLFWKNDLTGETLNAVFPADTTAYQIEAGAGAKYSFQLFYAKKRGLLPAAWKEEAPKGPTVWKVLWLDLETIDYLGITNNMSEQNHLASQRLARAFESFVEESTDGLVDIEITRMSIDQPVTALSYDPVFGYTIKPSDIDVKHLAFRKYDSVLAMARLDRFALKYAGVAFDPDNPREEPGYAVIVMMGDNPTPKGMADMKAVCLHEWLHLLSYFYSEWQLEIPNPDTPEQFGFDPFKGNRDLQYFKEALTMKAQANDGRFLGVPAEAWQYKPTHNPEKWNLSYLQEQEIPADFQPREEITVVSDEAVQEYIDSLYDDPINTDLIHNGMTQRGLEGLTDSLCKDIALFHLLNTKVMGINMGNGMTIKTMLGRDINTSTAESGEILISRASTVTSMDNELENGVLHEIDCVIRRSNMLIAGEMEEKDEKNVAKQIYDDIVNQMAITFEKTYDEKTGLWKHAWDEKKSIFWADKNTGLSQHTWSRALGWFAMAMVEVLDELPEDYQRRKEVKDMLQKVMTAVVKYQDPKTGVWYDVMDVKDPKNYLESSASCMFSYVLLKGSRLGYIDASLKQAGVKAYDGIINEFIKINNDKTISLTNCCSVSGLGPEDNPSRDGSFEYYISEPIRDNDAKGIAPFIWASLEMERDKAETVKLGY